MSDIVKFNSVEEFIIELRGEKVILDKNVATLYGVETREINQQPGQIPGWLYY